MTSVSATLTVYVPATEDTLGIKPGSGIVGSPVGGTPPRVRIDFEGNIHHAVNIVTYEDRLLHAAGRHTWNEGRGYPTVARQWVRAELLHAVGTYDANTWRVVEITDREALDAWVGLWKPS